MYQESISQTKGSEKCLDGAKKMSRFYQEETQKAQWIEIPLRSVKKRIKKGSIERNLLRICREAVQLEENSFFKKGKKHRSNLHIKLPKHLSTK